MFTPEACCPGFSSGTQVSSPSSSLKMSMVLSSKFTEHHTGGSRKSIKKEFQFQFSVSAQDSIVALGKAHMHSTLSQQPSQGCPQNSADICLVEHRLFSTLEGGMSAASFLHSSFLHTIKAVMLLRVHKVPQASEHLCCQAADQMWYLLCLPVYLPFHSQWLWHITPEYHITASHHRFDGREERGVGKGCGQLYGSTHGVTVSMSDFLSCHQCYCVGSSLAWGLNLRTVVYMAFSEARRQGFSLCTLVSSAPSSV